MRYELKGRLPEDGRIVKVELGWNEATGFFFGVDDQTDSELRSGDRSAVGSSAHRAHG
jgi:hypothetical protein